MGPGGGSLGHHVSQDPVAQMNTFRSYVSMLADPGSKDENKLKAAQALSEDLEVSTIILVLVFSEILFLFIILSKVGTC